MRPCPAASSASTVVQPGRRHVKAPQLGEVRRVRLGIDRQPAREGRGIGAHLGAALHARMPANGHHAGPWTAHILPEQSEIDDAGHGVRPVGVLGDAHRPDEDAFVRIGEFFGEGLDLRQGQAAARQQIVHRLGVERGLEVCVAFDRSIQELLFGPTALDQHFLDGVDEGQVAADFDQEIAVGDLRAKHRRIRVRGNPVALHARLAVGVDHHHARAALAAPRPGT